MSDKQMDLMLRIRANAAEALTAIKTVHEGIAKVGHGAAAIADYAKTGFGYLKTAIGWVLKPLELAAKGVIALGFAFAGLITKALWAAAADEKLINRMTAVYGSAEKATAVFGRMEAAARVSSHSTEDLADAMMTLKMYGLDTEANLGAVANTAKAMGENVSQVAFMVSALQSRGFKKFGIDIDKKDEKTIISYMDQWGKAQKIIAATDDAARKALFGIMGGRFGTTIKPTGLSDFTNALRTAIDQAFATAGTPLLKTATNFVQAALGKVTDLIQSGKLEEWGTKVGDALVSAAGTVLGVFRVGKEIFEKGPVAMKDAFVIIAPKIGQTIVAAMIEYLLTMKDIFVGMGKLIGAGLLQIYMGSELPGAGTLRKKMGYDTYLEPGIQKTIESFTPAGGKPSKELVDWVRYRSKIERAGEWEKLTPEQQAGFATASVNQMAVSGFEQAVGSIPDHAAKVAASVAAIWADTNDRLKTATGIDAGAVIAKARAEVRDMVNPGMVPLGLPASERYQWHPHDPITPDAPRAHRRPDPGAPLSGTYQRGLRGRGFGGNVSFGDSDGSLAPSMNVQSLTVRANNPRQMQNKLIRHSMGSGLAAAAY